MIDQDHKVYTKGIMIVTVRCTIWSVKVGNKIYASPKLSSLRKHLAKPNATLGTFVDVSYHKQTKINMGQTITLSGHFDHEACTFTAHKPWDSWGTLRGGDVIEHPDIPQAVIDEVIQYLSKQRKKFNKNLKEALSGE